MEWEIVYDQPMKESMIVYSLPNKTTFCYDVTKIDRNLWMDFVSIKKNRTHLCRIRKSTDKYPYDCPGHDLFILMNKTKGVLLK